MTAHIPHLYLPGEWTGDLLPLEGSLRHHVERVLRRRPGEAVSYTDGEGVIGWGELGDGEVLRGDESSLPPAEPALTLAVAPPDSRERQRFLVEKLAELGVRELVWLSTRRAQGRPPRSDKSRAWAVSALEQSRGAWIMRVGPRTRDLSQLVAPLYVADPGGGAVPTGVDRLTVAVGPEGGFEPDEIPAGTPTLGLGSRILRVETAALAIAARLNIV